MVHKISLNLKSLTAQVISEKMQNLKWSQALIKHYKMLYIFKPKFIVLSTLHKYANSYQNI